MAVLQRVPLIFRSSLKCVAKPDSRVRLTHMRMYATIGFTVPSRVDTVRGFKIQGHGHGPSFNIRGRGKITRLSAGNYTTNSGSDDPSKRDNQVKPRTFFVEHGLLKFFDIRIKLFLMRSFFDKNFKEEEFLIGAKQALCVVSGHLANHEYSELHGLVSEEAIQSMREQINNLAMKNPIAIQEDDVQHLSVVDLQFSYSGKGQKWATVLVRYFCWAKSALTKKIGDVEILNVPFPRVFRYSFQREFTPGVESQWIITEAIHDLGSA